mgnify:CR=1 FL=1
MPRPTPEWRRQCESSRAPLKPIFENWMARFRTIRFGLSPDIWKPSVNRNHEA